MKSLCLFLSCPRKRVQLILTAIGISSVGRAAKSELERSLKRASSGLERRFQRKLGFIDHFKRA